MDSRALEIVPEVDLSVKMDAMVHDLNEALKETACPNAVRVKVGFRRRTRSAGNLAMLGSRATHSDDSISERLQARSKEQGQSDSDEASANSQRRLAPYPLQKRMPAPHHQTGNVESDSVNENFSPLRTGARRKRKMKRMDCEPSDLPSTSTIVPPPLSLPPPTAAPSLLTSAAAEPPPVAVEPTLCMPSSLTLGFARLSLPGPSGVRTFGKKKKSKDNEGFEAAMGKRKRGNRERSVSGSGEVLVRRLPKSCRVLRPAGCQHGHEQMDMDPMSSSSLSSSESDAGIQTNDEGREGDDEQSDWFADPRVDEETDLEPDDPAFQNLLHGPLDQMSPDARQAYADRIEWLREGLNPLPTDREIRGGRRRVHDDRPGFSVNTSANEKVSRFLQDCQQLTLRLHHMEKEERDQLVQLVNMYSLRMRIEMSARGETCPILSKTSATPRTVSVDPGTLCTAEYKKRRKLPNSAALASGNIEMQWTPPALRPSTSKE